MVEGSLAPRSDPAGLTQSIIIAVSALILVQLSGIDLSARTGMLLAAGSILLVGVPHGALDIEIIAHRFGRTSFNDKLTATGLYLAVSATMLGLWIVSPAIALIMFIGIAIAHFGADWCAPGERFLGTTVGWTLVGLPALSHPHAVATLFTAIAGEGGPTVAALLLCSAVPATLCSLVYIGDIHRSRLPGAALIACLIAALALPPLVAFAVFFCGLHSPRHFAEALAEGGPLSRWRKIGIVVAVSALALGGGVAMFATGWFDAVDLTVVRVTFVLLSVLTLPHFLLEQLPILSRQRLAVSRVAVSAPQRLK